MIADHVDNRELVVPSRTAPVGEPDTVTRYPGMQSSREIRQPFVSAAMQVSAHAFVIRSIRVDNLSNQWLRLGSELDYIPPYTLGVIFNVRGVGTVTVDLEAPAVPGVVQAAPIALERYMVTMYDKPQMAAKGRAPLTPTA